MQFIGALYYSCPWRPGVSVEVKCGRILRSLKTPLWEPQIQSNSKFNYRGIFLAGMNYIFY